MVFIHDDDGNTVGKFNISKAKYITDNKENKDTRWTQLLRTKNGNHILAHRSQWQGEDTRFSQVTPEEAVEFMERCECEEKEIQKEFPDYKETESI